MKIKYLFSAILLASSLQATTINELFNSLQKQPISKIDTLISKSANMSQQKIYSSYYPKADIFASYTHYNTPYSLKPLDPIETAQLTSNNEPIPFSKSIQKVGIRISIPIFMKELSSLSEKAKYLTKNAKLKKKINFFQNEAIILGLNASLEYLDNLLVALSSTQQSLLKTKHDITISVNSGRVAGIELDKINEKLNQIDIAINNVKIEQTNVISKIEQFTNITIEHSVPLVLLKNPISNYLILLEPLKNSIDASLSDLKATKEKKYFPKIILNGLYTKNYAKDNIQDDRNIEEDFGYYEIVLSIPLYNKTQSTDIQLKKIALMKSKMKLNKTSVELKSQIKALKKELTLLKRSKELNQKNILNKKNLLKYAKVSFDEGRMTQEDYLRYEDELLNAKSDYFKIVSQVWQDIGKLAVIYGIDLKEIVK